MLYGETSIHVVDSLTFQMRHSLAVPNMRSKGRDLAAGIYV